MASVPVRVRFVGAGTMANTHAEALLRDGRVAIVAVVDPLSPAVAASTYIAPS